VLAWRPGSGVLFRLYVLSSHRPSFGKVGVWPGQVGGHSRLGLELRSTVVCSEVQGWRVFSGRMHLCEHSEPTGSVFFAPPTALGSLWVA
jgi:hypothetical protein